MPLCLLCIGKGIEIQIRNNADLRSVKAQLQPAMCFVYAKLRKPRSGYCNLAGF